jgi:hypothetical protein
MVVWWCGGMVGSFELAKERTHEMLSHLTNLTSPHLTSSITSDQENQSCRPSIEKKSERFDKKY